MSVERDNILPPEEAPDASSKLFREYAAEFVELARNATSADQRFLFLKVANIWRRQLFAGKGIWSKIRRKFAATATQGRNELLCAKCNRRKRRSPDASTPGLGF
jgi:hypothetical protein